MDEQRFDRLTRELAQPRTRRWTLGAIAAALGITARPKPASASFCFSSQECCGPGCMIMENDPSLPGTCYDPGESFCFDFARGITCPNGYIECIEQGRRLCKAPSAPCCATGKYCAGDCCSENESCIHWTDGQYTCWGGCPAGWDICNDRLCCGPDNPCVNGRCSDPDPCETGRGRRASKAEGVCCPPPHTKCGDQCCTGDQTCCGGGAHTTCCPKNKTCCPGPNGVACCDAAETYCCSGVCCANHWTCVQGECRENCLGDKINCGRNCCTKDQICFDAAQSTCSDKCPQGQTACGAHDCCLSTQQCKDGTCVQKCGKGQKQCGKTCCGNNQQCKDGACVKKKNARRRKRH